MTEILHFTGTSSQISLSDIMNYKLRGASIILIYRMQARRKVFAIGAANSGEGGGGIRKEVNGMFWGYFEM